MARLGQHFLIRKDVPKKILGALDLGRKETVIEIGPGHGELSFALSERLAGLEGKLIMIERDADLARSLVSRKELAESKVILGNALQELPGVTEGLEKYKIVGNLPYYISGYFFRTVSELANKPAKIVVMIQREVGERLCANPPEMNRLAAAVQFWGEPKMIMNLKPQDFRPAPKVDSVIVEIDTRGVSRNVSPEKYYETLRIIFQQPRKNILNNLAAGIKDKNKAELTKKLTEMNLYPEMRPQDLSVEQICGIAGIVG